VDGKSGLEVFIEFHISEVTAPLWILLIQNYQACT